MTAKVGWSPMPLLSSSHTTGSHSIGHTLSLGRQAGKAQFEAMAFLSLIFRRNDVSPALSRMAAPARRPEPVFRAIGATLKGITEGTFDSTDSEHGPAPWRAAHRHAGGENSRRGGFRCDVRGPSPRGWGGRWNRPVWFGQTTGHPHAGGENELSSLANARAMGHPHAGGENSGLPTTYDDIF